MQTGKPSAIQMINKWKRLCLVLLLLFSLFFTTGCWNKIEVNNTVEAEGLVFDLEGDQPSFSVQLAQASGPDQSGSSQSTKPVNISGTGRTFTEAARKVMVSLPRLPLWAHAGVTLIGEDLANQDMGRVADFIGRNRHVRKTSLLFITKGVSGKECLEAEVPMEAYSLPGLRKLIRIQENQLGIYMPITIDQFLEGLAIPGLQPAVPQVTIQEIEGKKVLKLDGTAVFKDRKMVGSLDETESQGYRFLSPTMVTGGLIIIPSPLDNVTDSKKVVSIELTRSQATVSPEIEENKLKNMKIHIEAEGNFYEQTFEGDILDRETINKMNVLIGEQIKQAITASITKAQLLDSDIFGWGRSIYRKNPDLWSQIEDDWADIFPGVKTEITVNFEIRRTYLLDKSFEFKE